MVGLLLILQEQVEYIVLNHLPFFCKYGNKKYKKKKIDAYERITRSKPKGINPKTDINHMINKNVILEYKCFIKNPLTNSLINRAEYKKIPKSSYPVRMVQMDSIKSIAYCNGYQVILKIVIKHKIVQVVFISGIMICGKGIMLLVS